ncbi:hypothetical protein FNV43_RR01978 [Rhamnella rubrinervis]|uniref:non-specific serine/threonine protein kinase n=1 Tax=Rhamnella rubrinervis TaxID=2594499 RepID=A0A8K0HQM1_9ROSA|nr:hypothetical protein FNV43_RR01978 [Rhamnella rubrinervis]
MLANASALPTNEYSARLLDSGNLVLFENESKKLLWQSFNYTTNTLLLNMKLGLDRKTGLNWFLTSWKSEDDPRIGNCTLRIDPTGSPQLILYKGQVPWWRAGHWNAIGFGGLEVIPTNYLFYVSFVNNDNEISIMEGMHNTSIKSRIVVDESGLIQGFVWYEQERGWKHIGSLPEQPCDQYGHCGVFGLCELNYNLEFECTCLPGFNPSLTVPDTSKVVVINGLSLESCKKECLRSCNCTAYSSANISEGGSGCITWHGNLIDTSSIGFFAYWFAKRKRKDCSLNITSEESPKEKLEESRRHPDLPFFDIRTIIIATDNFSATNMLGRGGFGSVFKGQLVNGQEMAVKRLSKHSGQGMQEFKNEVTVIVKLQHRNLVRLLGCYVTRRSRLDWSKRFQIVNGIARGILYLHQDSRLKIIHRDLKASNILLDASMNPKISDFGMARMFGEDQIQANTNRVVEYAMQGLCSTKSDVFSFDVLLLEIISGRKNTECINGSNFPNLIGHVWELWNEGTALDIVDPALCQPFSTDLV